MKKIIIAFVFSILLMLCNQGFAILWGGVDPCTITPLNPWCPAWENVMSSKCGDAGGFATINGDQCNCTLFFWTQLQNTQSCDAVPTAEELECSMCEQEWFSYENNQCLIPWRNAITNQSMTVPVACSAVQPCVSVWWEYYAWWQCCLVGSVVIDSECKSCVILSEDELADNAGKCSEDISTCATGHVYQENWQDRCCPSLVVDSQEDEWKKACVINTEWTAGMTMNADCLINWQCSYNVYETLWIRKSDQNPSVWSFVKDIVLAVTTFIGTVVAIVLVVSWILYIVSGIKGDTSMADKAKKWIFNSVVWLVLVVTSYAIVRLIQFLATAWWG